MLKIVESDFIGIEYVPQLKENEYLVRVIYQCNECKKLLPIDSFSTQEELDEFFDSLIAGDKPTKNTLCVECNPYLN